jgi:hypothetical protein
LNKPITEKGLAEWLKVKALSLNPRTAKYKSQQNKWRRNVRQHNKVIYYWPIA